LQVSRFELAGVEEGYTMFFGGNFWKDDQGQDLIENSLLMGFVALAVAGLFIGAGGSIKGVWSTTSSQLSYANSVSIPS